VAYRNDTIKQAYTCIESFNDVSMEEPWECFQFTCGNRRVSGYYMMTYYCIVTQ